ncbi:unnamed protein product [Penicillium salamii]|nr:unnamed protein product [Penicillium salamii]
MVGLESVKDSVKILFHRATRNQYRLQNGQPPLQTALNRVFLGPPGTGKTTVGKLYGQILADLGLLSDGAVLVKNPSDFIGAYVGWSEKQTKKILEEAKGKVLIIDDAYMLYPGSQSGTGRDTDVFRTAVIDTLVAELDNAPGNDRCVILLGYEEPMQEMFRKSNPGLARRFALNDAFHFTDFTVKQLGEILDLKIKGQGLQATDEARDVALQMLEQACHRPNFGNGGEVENLISQAKDAYEKRAVNTAQFSSTVVFTPGDFDLHHDRHLKAAARCKAHFQDMIGVDDFVHQFQQYQAAVATMRRRGVDPRPYIPFTFVFQGPPGTGKTSTARKMAQLFYDMGFLSAAELIECSASDLISPYQGQTGHRVTEWLERALGKVLFIDEAYRLARGENERQAVEELVDRLTKRRYARKLVVVLAGYKDEMVRLMLVNRGLNSRFETKIVFTPLPAEACWQVLQQELSSVGIEVTGDEDARHAAIQVFDRLANVQSWASARSVKKLSSAIILQVFGGARENESPSISTREIHRMLGRAEIDTLVEEAQAIVVKLSRKNAQWPAAVTNLADRLFQQYQLTGKLKTLNDAIGHMLEVLDTTPADHSQRPLILNNLSCYMSSRFERTGNPSDANLPSRHL